MTNKMKLTWQKLKSETINLKCPICDHQTAPPDYPYCEHTLFVYVDPSADDSFFDFVHSDMTKSLSSRFNKSSKLHKKLIMKLDLPYSCQVFDITESCGYYPTRVVVGFFVTITTDI